VTFETVTAAIGGGALSFDASFRSGPSGLSARGRMSLANADATAVIRGAAQPPVIGRLSSKFDVEGAGTNPAALVGSLSGSGSVTLEAAQIVGLDPKAIEVAVRAFERGTPIAPARIGDIVGRVMDAGSLTMPRISVPLAISAGRVRVGKLVAPPQSNDLAMSGALDLVDATIDARFTVFGAAEAAQRPEASILLKGPFAAPRRTVDVSALVSWLTMRSVDREAKRLEAAERAAKQIDGETALPGTGQAGAVQGGTPGGTSIGANLSAPAAQPQLAPALPPPVTLARPPGAILPRPPPRALPAAPLLLTPQ
jgi:AsmA-like C-terminal region